MRFVIITQYYPPEVGAAQTRLAATSRALISLGHQVEVVTGMPNYPKGEIFSNYLWKFYAREERDSAVVHRFWLYASQGKAFSRLMTYLSLMVTSLIGISKIRTPDVIFVNSGPIFLGLTGAVYSWIFRKPMVFYVADLWPRSVQHLDALGAGARILLELALALESWIYRQSRYVVAVTEGVREILIKEKGLRPEKVMFLPNGVDTDIFSPRPVKEDLVQRYKLQGKKVFMYTGNHGYAHALETLVEAAHLLSSNKDIVIMLVGGGSEKKKLQDLATAKGVENLIFVDPVDPVILADYLQIADFGLIHVRNSPLAEETRPAKMFPMMAMGKPILYAGFGEGARLLEKVQGGWVIEPENPEALKDKILELLGATDAVTKGQNNLRFVRENLNFMRLVSEWAQGLKF